MDLQIYKVKNANSDKNIISNTRKQLVLENLTWLSGILKNILYTP